MKFEGWVYRKNCLPWTKVFTIDCTWNNRFSTENSIKFPDLARLLLKCDICGYVKYNKNDSLGIVEDFFDIAFSASGINIKQDHCDTVICNGVKIQDEDENTPDFRYNPIKNADAQIVIIDDSYAYFSCTSYGFYENMQEPLKKDFNCINLGGMLVSLGVYPEIDELLRDILKK